jgi:hypothetical protein
MCGDDRAVRPDAQRERARHVGSAVELDSDHSPFFSTPDLLTEFLVARHAEMLAAGPVPWAAPDD